MPSDLGKRRSDALARVSRSLPEIADDDLLEGEGLPDRAGFGVWMAEAIGRSPGDLRRERRRALARIAALDAGGEIDLPRVVEALSDLADACLQATLDDAGAGRGFSVIAMGKLGARELNYVSDIDLMFVTRDEPSDESTFASSLLTVLGEFSPEGRAYEIDLNLRPEGRNGPLVRSLDGYLEYYRRWAEQWEFQALLKARACAGDMELGHEFVERTREFVFPVDVSSERVAAIRRMKQRVEEHAARSRRGASSGADDVKLGPGGIRDVEFAIQLLQLVHGSADPTVREAATLSALTALMDAGYIAEEDGAGLSVDYRWLRNVEHRLQLQNERRVRKLPTDHAGLTALAHAVGFNASPRAGADARFAEAHRAVLADVRSRFERLFYRPMVESLAEGLGPRMSPEALRQRLEVLGFRDVERSARTLEGLVAGTSRRAKLLRVLTPAVLRWLTSTPVPDQGLFAFLRLGEAVEHRLDTLNALRDNPPGIAFLAKVLGSGRLLGEVLTHVPEELATIADPDDLTEPKGRERLIREGKASLGWRSPDERLDGLRRFKRREMLRVALLDLKGEQVPVVGTALSDLADACIVAALGDVENFAVIGMGKLGGHELNYSSDIDVMFVHDMAADEAERVAEDLMRAIGEVTPEGQAFRIDAALRPEGRSGPLARSLRSFEEYYARWAEPWEFQALLKARVAAGDGSLGERFLEIARPLAHPEQLDDASIAQLRHLKARMEKERVTRGADPRSDYKMGPGGLADVEFSIQLLQRRYGAMHPTLRIANTIEAIEAARALDLLSPTDASTLSSTYSFLMRLRNRAFFIYGRPVDVLPRKPEELEALGVAMGFDDQPRQELEEQFMRATRRCRKVAERIIFG